MFIKILTPNHNGKIELTVKDLECLIQEAVDKATKEKCAECSRVYYGGGISYLSTTPNITLSKEIGDTWEPGKITCSTESIVDVKDTNVIGTEKINTLMSKINETCN